MIQRDLAERIKAAAGSFPVVAITGPRQGGKSTLARAVFPERDYVNLELPDVRSFALQNPRAFLARFPDGAVINEIQRCPELLTYLPGLIDGDPTPGKWILTGSQNLAFSDSVSQSLAGRTAILNLLPLSRTEVCRFHSHPISLEEVLLTGGYPRIFDQQLSPADWLGYYVSSYIERDVRMITNVGDLTTFQRFMELCASKTAQLLNLSALATDAGIAQPTAKAWLSIMETSFLTFRLPAYHANIHKRLVKMPKLHFYDTGLVCWLLGIRDVTQLCNHPLLGTIFETWVISEIIKHRNNQGEQGGVFFYRDRQGIEIDLIVECGDRCLVIEAKVGQTVSTDILRKSRKVAYMLEAAEPAESVVVYGGESRQDRNDAIVMPWSMLHKHSWMHAHE